jgi:hypothetical protein
MKFKLEPPLPTGYNLPDARFDMPELWTPGRKPVGAVKIDWSHPMTQKLSAVMFSMQGGMFELANGLSRYSDTTLVMPTARGLSRQFAVDKNVQLALSAGSYFRFDEATNGFGIFALLDCQNLTYPNFLASALLSSTSYGWYFRLSESDGGGDSRVLIMKAHASGYKKYRASASDLVAAGSKGVAVAVTQSDNLLQTAPTFYVGNTAYTGTSVAGTGSGAIANFPGISQPKIGSPTGGGSGMNGNMYALYVWKRKLSALDIANLNRDPYQFLIPA